MTFEEFDGKLCEIINEAIREQLGYTATLGALAAHLERYKIFWATQLTVQYQEHRQAQNPHES